MNAKLRVALGAPLIGVILAWSIFFIGTFEQTQLVDPYNSSGDVYWGVYSFLVGIAVFAAASVFSFRVADGEVASHKTRAGTAVLRFTGFAVVVSAVTGGVYAFVIFVSSISTTRTSKLLDTYLPIILVTGVVVVSILQATVWRKSAAEPGAPADPRKRALGLAWAIPIIGSAFALIIGLLSYGGNQNVSIWVWVVTLSIIMISVLLGTHFASVAHGLVKLEARSNTVEVGAGASKLNYVLAVIFGAVVNIVAFTGGLSAASALGQWKLDGKGNPLSPGLNFSSDWWANQFAPSLVFLLLAQAIVFLSVTMRHRSAE